LYDSYGTVNTNVANFINNTNKWFLHFKESHLLNAKVLYKNNRSINDNSVVIFKKGVRVAEWLTNMSSLFDYNINDIPLNESRCVERYTANAYAIRCFYYFSTPNDIKLLFNSLKNYNETIFEHQFDFNSYVNSRSSERDEEFKKCFYNVFGQNSIIVDNNRFFQSLTSKGFNPVVLPYHYYEFLSKVGVKTYLQVLSSNEISGIELYEPSENFNNLFIKIWNSMENLKLTNSKEIPTLKIFNQVMDFGSIRMGFYKDNTVYINQSLVSDKPCLELIMTLLEEIGHYVTGACDESRDFQDYFIRLAASLIFSND
jgi:hypothetical protein